MKYLTIKETAIRWGVSERMVNSFCTQGRVKGAQKFGVAWAIPEDAQKPDDPRRERKKAVENMGSIKKCKKTKKKLVYNRIAMPLLSTPFKLGGCIEAIEQIEDLDSRKIALAEYYYFSGQTDKVSSLVEPYLFFEDIALQVSACWLYTFANLEVGKIKKARKALNIVQDIYKKINEETSSREKGYAISAYTAISVLFHLPMPKILKSLKTYIHMMPPGLRLYILYIEAHHSYINKHYGTAIGIAETALALEGEIYPIPNIYLHLIACVGYLNMRYLEQAKEHLLEAWKIAQPDDLIQPIAEHHGLVGGTLEATIKRLFPNDFKRIINLTNKYSSGWRKIHNDISGHNVADNLTTTEFAAAMLAARGWTNQEISSHMQISEYTVRHYISNALQKLGINQRKELEKHLL